MRWGDEIMKAQHVLKNFDQSSKDITDVLSAINDPECQLKSGELLRVFKNNLEMLKHNYLLLTEAEFHLEVAKALEQTQHCLKAVVSIQVNEDSQGALFNYYEATLQAMTRGVQITKIFVTRRQELLNRNIQKILYKLHQDGMDVRIAYLEDLQWLSDDINVHTLNFAIYNDGLITDRASNKSNYFGKRTTNPAEIDKYIGFFDLISVHSHRFASESIQSQLQLIDTLPI